MATPRETLKYYFRKHALPTEQQFAELIDAFVHKDEDTITQEKIDGLINALAGKMSSETFEAFKTEIQETVTNNGNDLSALTERVTTAEGNITTLRDDVDTNTDHISGLNQRVEALEKEQPAQVTGNFLKQIADLDSYEGTEGEIVQYIGATNEEYRRGFCYERYPEGQTVFIAQGEEFRECKLTPPHKSAVKYKQIGTLHLWTLGTYSHFILQEPAVGVLAYRPPVSTGMPTSFAIQDIRTVDGSIEVKVQGNWSQVTERTLDLYETEDGYRWFKDYHGDNALILDEDGHPTITTNRLTDYPNPQTASSDIIRSTPASWQVIPTSPCVN